MRYDNILIDTLNTLYKLREGHEHPSILSSKYVYRDLAAKYIKTIKDLKDKYLTDTGTIYLLFDNPTSRLDLQKSFYFASRKHIYPKYKEQRAKESREFYNTLDLIRYYYLTNVDSYICIQVQNLEADDLVKPVLTTYCSSAHNLLVTNDYDWTRYLSDTVDWLPSLASEPELIKNFIEKMGFLPTETSIIIYKSLFGDPSDNIPHIIPKNSKTYSEFLEIVREGSIRNPEDLIDKGRCMPKDLFSSVLDAVRNNEKQYKINIQLTSTIPISEKHLRAVSCKGRNSAIITEAIEVALKLREEKKEFVFGKIRNCQN